MTNYYVLIDCCFYPVTTWTVDGDYVDKYFVAYTVDPKNSTFARVPRLWTAGEINKLSALEKVLYNINVTKE